MKRLLLIFIPFMLVGCAAPSTDIRLKTPEGKEYSLNFEKEYRAIDMNIYINPTTGEIKISAASWESLNANVIVAQSERDKVGVQYFEKGIDTAVKAALKSIVPVP